MTNKIGFPGLGLEFNISETAFSLFGLNIQWYGIIIALGICAAFMIFYFNSVKKEGIDADSVFNIALVTVPVAIIGARFIYVVTNLEHYNTFADMINIRAGGLAIYGGIIFGLAAILIYSYFSKKNALSILDALAPGVMIGQAIGRWGNFVNAEAYGWSEGVENLPWRMELERVVIDGKYAPSIHFVHPTFLYESLWNILGFVLIMAVLYRKKKYNGEIFCEYMGWYGIGRAIIETFRTDSLYIFNDVKFSVFVGIVAFMGAIVLSNILYARTRRIDDEDINIADDIEETEKLTDAESETLAEAALLDGNIEDFEAFEEFENDNKE